MASDRLNTSPLPFCVRSLSVRNSLRGWPQGVDKHQRRQRGACSHLQRADNATLISSASIFPKMSQLQLSYLKSATGLSGFCAHLCGARMRGSVQKPLIICCPPDTPDFGMLGSAHTCNSTFGDMKHMLKALPRGDATHPGIKCKSAPEELTASVAAK